MKVAILGNHIKPIFVEVIDQLLQEFSKRNIEVSKLGSEDSVIGYDLVLSVGGDGTFLESAIRVGKTNIPIIGINVGRLGFLAANSADYLDKLVDELCKGNFRVTERSLLELVNPNDFFDFNFALNEVSILKNDSSSMITVHTHIDGIYVNSYWGDGLLVVTPTGSTAYSLSVGGPIMTPQTKSFILSPVAPHSLNVRPIVVSDDVEITLEVECRSGSYMLVLDSRFMAVPTSLSLTIRKSQHSIKVIELPDNDYFNTLRTKLMWGADRRN